MRRNGSRGPSGNNRQNRPKSQQRRPPNNTNNRPKSQSNKNNKNNRLGHQNGNIKQHGNGGGSGGGAPTQTERDRPRSAPRRNRSEVSDGSNIRSVGSQNSQKSDDTNNSKKSKRGKAKGKKEEKSKQATKMRNIYVGVRGVVDENGNMVTWLVARNPANNEDFANTRAALRLRAIAGLREINSQFNVPGGNYNAMNLTLNNIAIRLALRRGDIRLTFGDVLTMCNADNQTNLLFVIENPQRPGGNDPGVNPDNDFGRARRRRGRNGGGGGGGRGGGGCLVM